MAVPNSRQTLIDYCLRTLGEPVLEVNVDEDQLSDRIDEALQFYHEGIDAWKAEIQTIKAKYLKPE
jgi:hypothetical protein